MVSSNTAICMLPRALTRNRVLSSVSCTLMEMFDCVSRSSRARISRDVTFLPSRPASGPSFTENSICTVAGSISTNGNGSASSANANVSPMSTSSNPANPAMSPAVAEVTSLVCSPANCLSLMIFAFCFEPSLRSTLIWSPCLTSPDKIRPMAIRPTYSSQSMLLTSIRNGASSMTGGGTRSTTVSNRSFMSLRGPSSVRSANPILALP